MRWFVYAPGPRVGLDGEGTLHHARQLGGGVVGHGPSQQIGYLQCLQPRHAMYHSTTKDTQEARIRQTQDNGQAAVHAGEEEAEVLGIELRSGRYIENTSSARGSPRYQPIIHPAPYYHPRPSSPPIRFCNIASTTIHSTPALHDSTSLAPASNAACTGSANRRRCATGGPAVNRGNSSFNPSFCAVVRGEAAMSVSAFKDKSGRV